jgi:predicted nucleic acid-binding Zn ribbon protein
MDTLSRVIKKILNSNPDLRKGLGEARVLELWAKAVGPQIANRARAVQLKGKTIMVAVDHPVWKQELLANKRLVLEKLNATLNLELGQLAGATTHVDEIFILNPTKAVKVYPKK